MILSKQKNIVFSTVQSGACRLNRIKKKEKKKERKRKRKEIPILIDVHEADPASVAGLRAIDSDDECI